jgi:hypothetical protein
MIVCLYAPCVHPLSSKMAFEHTREEGRGQMRRESGPAGSILAPAEAVAGWMVWDDNSQLATEARHQNE